MGAGERREPAAHHGMLRQHASTPARQHASTPARQHASTPARQHAATPPRRHAATPPRRHAATPPRRHAARVGLLPSALWRVALRPEWHGRARTHEGGGVARHAHRDMRVWRRGCVLPVGSRAAARCFVRALVLCELPVAMLRLGSMLAMRAHAHLLTRREATLRPEASASRPRCPISQLGRASTSAATAHRPLPARESAQRPADRTDGCPPPHPPHSRTPAPPHLRTSALPHPRYSPHPPAHQPFGAVCPRTAQGKTPQWAT